MKGFDCVHVFAKSFCHLEKDLNKSSHIGTLALLILYTGVSSLRVEEKQTDIKGWHKVHAHVA